MFSRMHRCRAERNGAVTPGAGPGAEADCIGRITEGSQLSQRKIRSRGRTVVRRSSMKRSISSVSAAP